jgi:hypothetical protein
LVGGRWLARERAGERLVAREGGVWQPIGHLLVFLVSDQLGEWKGEVVDVAADAGIGQLRFEQADAERLVLQRAKGPASMVAYVNER